MDLSIIITICTLLLLSYIFELTSSKTKVPSVILLLALGWGVKEVTLFFNITIPDLTPALSILGTIGLILIVLEGSLELELNKRKLPFIAKSTIMSFFPLLIMSLILGYAFSYYGDMPFKYGLTNAIPFSVISSAIAIPSVQHLVYRNREFITYETSLSDIFGVVFFNFLLRNEIISSVSFLVFFLELFLILAVTFVATLGLSFLLSKIKHSVKFAPIILIIVLIYDVSKIYHLPALVFILLFGIFLGNLDELKHYKFIQRLQPDILNKEVHKFNELIGEFSFLIRSLFFLLFGYMIETRELLNTNSIIWALCISFGIFILRGLFLKILNLPLKPLLFIAPRGLITILLFFTIPIEQSSELVNKSMIIQVIILTALMMMFGLMITKTESKIHV